MLEELPAAAYYGYLVAYNVIYVVPLAAIVVAFALTLGRRKLTEREGRALKLLSGTLMLGLGAVLVGAPSWLDSVVTAVALVALARAGGELEQVADELQRRELKVTRRPGNAKPAPGGAP